MQVDVEFYGVPRQRAGVDRISLQFDAPPVRLGDLLDQLRSQFPNLLPGIRQDRPAGGDVPAEFVANVNGDRFVRQRQTLLAAGDKVLLMSADAGG